MMAERFLQENWKQRLVIGFLFVNLPTKIKGDGNT